MSGNMILNHSLHFPLKFKETRAFPHIFLICPVQLGYFLEFSEPSQLKCKD